MKRRCGFFKNSWFRRFARREKITDKALKDAIARADKKAAKVLLVLSDEQIEKLIKNKGLTEVTL